jgi:Holliday junction resolvasome RuvABC endonuclease subunit
MRPKKKLPRKPVRRQTVNQTKRGESAKSRDSGLSRRLNDLAEQIDIMVPEVTARIAALEHLLLKKQLCTRTDLVLAREFVRIQED